MTHRMVTATLALIGLIVALYLSLWRVGLIGTLACGAEGGCDTVQTSSYAAFLGIPVAFYGVAGYVALLGVSLFGLQPRWIVRREPTIALAILAGLGVAFSAYLTYLEAAVIHAWCGYCILSAGIITGILVAAIVGFRDGQRRTEANKADSKS